VRRRLQIQKVIFFAKKKSNTIIQRNPLSQAENIEDDYELLSDLPSFSYKNFHTKIFIQKISNMRDILIFITFTNLKLNQKYKNPFSDF